MSWIAAFVIIAIFLAVFVMKKSGEISMEAARGHLNNGAMVIDVRTPGEFSAGHLPGAINIPLDEIETAVPGRLDDKRRALLLHCASGMRSGIAQKKLNRMGYTNAFNLGSYGRAESVLKAGVR